ncbi:hypothetical protein HK405_009896, partial [Cladochytrium tenue]
MDTASVAVLAASAATCARAKVLAQLKAVVADDHAAALYVRGGQIQTRLWTDTEARFRQESFFFYLTGVDDPDFHLLVDLRTDDAHLLAPLRDEDHALWCGKPASNEAILAAHPGLAAVHYDDKLATLLVSMHRAGGGGRPVRLYVLDGQELPEAIAGLVTGGVVELDDSQLRAAVVEARVVKSPPELEIMRMAARVTGEAHKAAMRAVADGAARSEADLDALFRYECARRGAATQAYVPIVAAGRNAATLHYVRNDAPLPTPTRPGGGGSNNSSSPLVLVDAGCEVACYASDVTRSFPAGGRFEGEAAVVYAAVLDVLTAVLAAIRPGVEWEDMHRLAESVTVDGLLKAGLVTGSKEELLAHHVHAVFFPHGIGHLLGIDVHDCGGYPTGVERIQEPGIRYLRMRRKLVPGMVVTVEPGIYFVDPILDKAL